MLRRKASLRNQQLWDNSVTNKVKGGALWWLKLKRYFIFLCVGFAMCDSMERACSPAARLWLEAGPPLANVMEKRRNFMAVFSLSPLFSFVPLWRMTLDILFTYLTMDERNEGWGSKAPWVLKGILISKNELKLIHFCLRSLKLDGYQTRHYDGDISGIDAINSLMGNTICLRQLCISKSNHSISLNCCG